eukprot:363813-Chlamydomonas_euryale.AAC.6
MRVRCEKASAHCLALRQPAFELTRQTQGYPGVALGFAKHFHPFRGSHTGPLTYPDLSMECDSPKIRLPIHVHTENGSMGYEPQPHMLMRSIPHISLQVRSL